MYTAESTFYRDMNATLMARKDKSFDTYIKVCYEGLKKKALKIFNNDQLFRGTVLSDKEIKQIQQSLKQKKKIYLIVFVIVNLFYHAVKR
jgi:hypothetical protein